MKFNSQICTTKIQSERLLALGLKKKTADLYYSYYRDRIGYTYDLVPKSAELGDKRSIPAWSLHRLIEMMPTVITHDDYSLILGINATCVYYADDEYAETFKAFEGNLYGCVVKCIEWLIKAGYFNKEYLEE
jgi:hypothetical protein